MHIYFSQYREPFQVGDAILIDGKRYNVKKMGLLTTWMTDTWGIRSIWSNGEILGKLDGLENLSRTRQPRHNLSFYIGQDIDDKQIEQFIHRFQKFIDDKMPSECGHCSVVIGDFDRFMRCKVQLWIVSFISFADGKARWKAQTTLYRAMRKILKQLNITSPIDPIAVHASDGQ